jgi:ring-1,2-phenylacetyl-CoA epoxidase subunit PaaC
VPELPAGSPVPDEDRLAYFRNDLAFRNVRLAEVPNGDFAEAVAKILIYSTWRLSIFERLVEQPRRRALRDRRQGRQGDVLPPRLRRPLGVTLARGTEESRTRLLSAIDGLWPLWTELFETHPVETAVAEAGIGVDPAEVADEAGVILDQVFAAAGIDRPEGGLAGVGVHGQKGRDGLHTEALSKLLAEMQVVARAHPEGRW